VSAIKHTAEVFQIKNAAQMKAIIDGELDEANQQALAGMEAQVPFGQEEDEEQPGQKPAFGKDPNQAGGPAAGEGGKG
jgi:hypothetical protein